MVEAEVPQGRQRLRRRFVRPARGEAHTQRFSTMLRKMVETGEERISLGAMVSAFGDRAFGALLFILAVPNLLPLPPGSSSILGAPLIIVAVQLAIGRSPLWLPRVLADRSLKRADLKGFLDKVLPYLRKSELLLRPRLAFLFGPVGDRVIGVLCLLLSLILFLPIPLGNMAPGFAIAILALALLQHDGIAALIGLVASLAAIWLLIAVYGTLLWITYGWVSGWLGWGTPAVTGGG